MTAKQFFEFKPGVTWGNVLTMITQAVLLVIFVSYMRADINTNHEMAESNTALLHDHVSGMSSAVTAISDRQIDLMARLQIAEARVLRTEQFSERLQGIETSLQFIAESIRELKDGARKINSQRPSLHPSP